MRLAQWLVSNSAGGMCPISPWSRLWVQQSMYSATAISTSPTDFQPPLGRTNEKDHAGSHHLARDHPGPRRRPRPVPDVGDNEVRVVVGSLVAATNRGLTSGFSSPSTGALGDRVRPRPRRRRVGGSTTCGSRDPWAYVEWVQVGLGAACASRAGRLTLNSWPDVSRSPDHARSASMSSSPTLTDGTTCSS